MKILDDFDRLHLDAATYLEPRFNYLKRTARPPFARIRDLLQQWVDKYPEFAMPAWVGRFQSNDDPHHIGAFFELYMRALLDYRFTSTPGERPSSSGSKRKPRGTVKAMKTRESPPSIEEVTRTVRLILERAGATRADLFGSLVQGGLRRRSDIDILVELSGALSLLDVIGIQQDLEHALGRRVDLVEYAAIKPLLRERILAQEIRIF